MPYWLAITEKQYRLTLLSALKTGLNIKSSFRFYQKRSEHCARCTVMSGHRRLRRVG